MYLLWFLQVFEQFSQVTIWPVGIFKKLCFKSNKINNKYFTRITEVLRMFFFTLVCTVAKMDSAFRKFAVPIRPSIYLSSYNKGRYNCINTWSISHKGMIYKSIIDNLACLNLTDVDHTQFLISSTAFVWCNSALAGYGIFTTSRGNFFHSVLNAAIEDISTRLLFNKFKNICISHLLILRSVVGGVRCNRVLG